MLVLAQTEPKLEAPKPRITHFDAGYSRDGWHRLRFSGHGHGPFGGRYLSGLSCRNPDDDLDKRVAVNLFLVGDYWTPFAPSAFVLERSDVEWVPPGSDAPPWRYPTGEIGKHIAGRNNVFSKMRNRITQAHDPAEFTYLRSIDGMPRELRDWLDRCEKFAVECPMKFVPNGEYGVRWVPAARGSAK